MAAAIVLLRGVNLGSSNRLAMPALREALTGAGFAAVRTHVQSGNIVLDSARAGDEVAAAVSQVLVEEFGLDVPIVVRTDAEFAAVVAGNPFPDEAASNPKLLQVTFRAEPLEPEDLAGLKERAGATEKVAGNGREIYSWHPDGIARSKLAMALTPKYAAATARNWATVTKLLEMATTDAD
jgi:uncharacterized protein (DUF1697 family)